MYPDHSVSGVDRARGRGRGVGGRSDRRRRAVVGRLARCDHAAGVRAGARHRHRRGDAGCGAMLRALWRMPEKIRRGRRERRQARGRHAITQGLLAIGHGDAAAARAACRRRAPACRRTIRWRCCCTRNRRSSTATATARSARSAPWPSARTRGCWACAACSSRRSAPTIRSPP